MSGLRAGLGLPGADAGTVVRAARLAEEWNVDALWIGDPAHRAANADDTYVMVAAAAAAATTTDLRLGVFLSARSSSPPLRIAEDIGVVDQISSGRLSVAFSPSATSPADEGWLADLERIARAPREWDLGDGRRMPVTPPPAQPAVPMAVLECADDGTDPTTNRPFNARRSAARPFATAWSPVLLSVDWPDATTPPSAAGLRRLKAHADATGADEVILLVESATDLDAVFAAIGTVVAPCLRAADDEVGILALDATRWLSLRLSLDRH